ncbi:MAG: 3'-5' exonuclease, partial [Solirubrobacteraceae bacterium]
GLAGLEPEDEVRLLAAHALIAGERRLAAGRSPADLLVRSGYGERALSGPGAASARANMRKLLRLAREFEGREGRDIRRFADRLAAGRLGSSREQDAQLAETDAVRLMTVHAAKGLEFPVVCLADIGHGPPIGLPLILTDGERVGLRLPTLEAPRVDALAYAELRACRDKAAVAEEQRIAYVAMTRARERLIVSGAAHFAHWPAATAASPAIAWLGPAMVSDLPTRATGPMGVSDLMLGGAPVRLTLAAATTEGAATAEGAATTEGAATVVAAATVEGAATPPAIALAGPSVAAGSPRAVQESLFDPDLGGWDLSGLPTPPAKRELAPAPAPPAPAAPEHGVDPPALAADPLAGTSPPPKREFAPLGLARAAPPPPTSVSYSSLVDHARCGYGYYLRRVLGLAEVPAPAAPGEDPADRDGLDAARRGRIVHALLERLDFARPVAPAAAAVRGATDAEDLDGGEVEAIAGLVAAFGRSPLCRRLARSTTVIREASFALTVGELLVGGYIDVLGHEADGTLLVVDYKTDRLDVDADLTRRVASDYEVQRRIYALAALRTGAPAVEVAYSFLRRPDETVSMRYAAADAPGLELGLEALAAPLLAGSFVVSPQPRRALCATCPGRARLCSWDEEHTLRQVAVHEG